MINRLKCWWWGHKRRVKVDQAGDRAEYRCPRCGELSYRKVRAAKKETKGVTK